MKSVVVLFFLYIKKGILPPGEDSSVSLAFTTQRYSFQHIVAI